MRCPAIARRTTRMSSFPIVVPDAAPPAVHVPVAKATDVAMRAPAPRTGAGAGTAPVAPPREEVDDGNDEVFKRKRGAFAKDCACFDACDEACGGE